VSAVQNAQRFGQELIGPIHMTRKVPSPFFTSCVAEALQDDLRFYRPLIFCLDHHHNKYRKHYQFARLLLVCNNTSECFPSISKAVNEARRFSSTKKEVRTCASLQLIQVRLFRALRAICSDMSVTGGIMLVDVALGTGKGAFNFPQLDESLSVLIKT
jgi:hypothetical protein